MCVETFEKGWQGQRLGRDERLCLHHHTVPEKPWHTSVLADEERHYLLGPTEQATSRFM